MLKCYFYVQKRIHKEDKHNLHKRARAEYPRSLAYLLHLWYALCLLPKILNDLALTVQNEIKGDVRKCNTILKRLHK